jgi:hypothetical protein
MNDFPMVDVIHIQARADNRLWLRFTDGCEGEWDLSPLSGQSGEMVAPLRDPAMFARVFIEMGAPTWPTGFDIDPINLHMQMRDAGVLTKSPAA